ncbi:GNAT family N-acetyltransferase [Agromyces intestinalis]|uniref:GNAT family N-acetyltransferase n=1 Tax=Agromyces intestinalis TaxID=2592652 RepID=A0A5C1YGD7_9MICO|nr:GNAT family N-acetyltransferase [Agromyces intestinalis]QEO14490.1 GNAT family N-acetyltransferase [Agromyces intestinalis]
MRLTLVPWSADDLPLLVRANAPEMTRFIGGPETSEQLSERNERYLRLNETGEAHMFRVDADGVPAGSIGWWRVEHDGEPAYETGWFVLPEWQGHGVARAALREVVRRVAEVGDRRWLVAYPGVDNPASNALCRSAGFEHVGGGTMPWRGGELAFNTWALDVSARLPSVTPPPAHP